MKHAILFILAAFVFCGLVSCSSTSSVASSSNKPVRRISSVKTTAYTHSESDHIVYGAQNAVGGTLKYGRVRSAATDWSVYPVGTRFQIEGQPYVYEVDDYGSALVGTNTIDLYTPTKVAMNDWGARKVNIRVIQWGSFSRSLAIMNERKHNTHVRKMVNRIEKSS
jgi:3D (Asp-Asp-Asp) domain-containing protein